jgi:hypothetical protein
MHKGDLDMVSATPTSRRFAYYREMQAKTPAPQRWRRVSQARVFDILARLT